MNFTQRNLLTMFCLMIITFGFYAIYWLVATKQELNNAGAHIPTVLLFIIPIANIYFMYKFAEAFSIHVLKEKSHTIPYFLLLFFLLPLGELICQAHMNTIAQN